MWNTHSQSQKKYMFHHFLLLSFSLNTEHCITYRNFDIELIIYCIKQMQCNVIFYWKLSLDEKASFYNCWLGWHAFDFSRQTNWEISLKKSIFQTFDGGCNIIFNFQVLFFWQKNIMIYFFFTRVDYILI